MSVSLIVVLIPAPAPITSINIAGIYSKLDAYKNKSDEMRDNASDTSPARKRQMKYADLQYGIYKEFGKI